MKRGQVTIFIISALVIVGIVLTIFLLRGTTLEDFSSRGDFNPQTYLKDCIEDNIRESVSIISRNGGSINPELNYSLEGVDVAYLCYNNNYYLRCINQQPLLLDHVKKEIKEYIKEDFESCFDDLVSDLERKNEEVQSNYGDFDVVLRPDFVQIKTGSSINFISKGDSRSYDNFDIFIDSRLYNNLVVAQEIVSQEAEYCNFETIGFGLIYPEFGIDKFELGEGSTYYKILNKKSQEEFQFLVRSCVIPPGF